MLSLSAGSSAGEWAGLGQSPDLVVKTQTTGVKTLFPRTSRSRWCPAAFAPPPFTPAATLKSERWTDERAGKGRSLGKYSSGRAVRRSWEVNSILMIFFSITFSKGIWSIRMTKITHIHEMSRPSSHRIYFSK